MKLTPQLILDAYTQGAFPMADDAGGAIRWYSPDPRAIQPFLPGDPLGMFKVRRSLAKHIRHGKVEVTTDRCFAQVIHACAEPRGEDNGVWISDDIRRAYIQLHRADFAHSVEAWRDGELVGGLYGVAIGAAFFGESMFSREANASQTCYVWLIDRLRKQDYRLLDVQFVNPHLAQFGVVEVTRGDYLSMLTEAIHLPCRWDNNR